MFPLLCFSRIRRGVQPPMSRRVVQLRCVHYHQVTIPITSLSQNISYSNMFFPLLCFSRIRRIVPRIVQLRFVIIKLQYLQHSCPNVSYSNMFPLLCFSRIPRIVPQIRYVLFSCFRYHTIILRFFVLTHTIYLAYHLF